MDRGDSEDDTPSFRERFDAMVRTLRAHPRVEVYSVEVRPPATEEAIRAAEAIVGPLPADIRSFYAAHDGVFLEWGLRDAPNGEHTPPFGHPDDGHPPGCINLLPIAHAMSPSWEEESHVNEIQDEHQEQLFGATPDPQPPVRAVCFDNYARYHHGDLVFGAPGDEPVAVVSTDYGADMDSSDFVGFSVYLDMTLALYGVDRYEHGVGIGWSREPQRRTAWTERPGLDAILARLESGGDED